MEYDQFLFTGRALSGLSVTASFAHFINMQLMPAVDSASCRRDTEGASATNVVYVRVLSTYK